MLTDVVMRRIVAVIIDGIILFVVSIIVLTVLNLIGIDMWDVDTSDFSFSATSTFGGTLVSAALSLAYKAWMEGTYNGQTLGKQALGIRVVQQANGLPISMESALIRAAFWVVPFTLLGWGIFAIVGFIWLIAGLISLIASPIRQRLGDRVAHTVVVRDDPTLPAHTFSQTFGIAQAATGKSGPDPPSMVHCQYCLSRFTLNLADTKTVNGQQIRICPNCGAPISAGPTNPASHA